MGRIGLIFGLGLWVGLICLPATGVAAERTVRETGILQEIEQADQKHSSVVIDGRGFILDPQAEVFDFDRNRIGLQDLTLPIRVEYHYRYTPKGPVIRRIQVIPEVVPE